MNGTQNITIECQIPVPAALLWVRLVHNYCVMVIGTLGNALALWCVATCTKTGQPMKVLVFTTFLPILLLCLITQPVAGELWTAFLTCNPDRTSIKIFNIMVFITFFLMLIEVTTIAAIAVVRAAAICSPYRPKLSIRDAVLLVVVTCTYAILTTLGRVGVRFMGLEVDKRIRSVIDFVTMTLPSLITATSYTLMIFVIQRNKRRLVAYQQQEMVTTTMDQAMLAMLAVFISNLVSWLPFSIYLLVNNQTPYLTVIFYIIYATHFMIDPLLYMWLNINYRNKISYWMTNAIRSVSYLGRRASVQEAGHNASPDHNGYQEEINL